MARPTLQESAAQNVSRLRDVPLHSDVGSRMLDVSVAFYDALAGQPAETMVARARRGLADGILIDQANVAAVYGFLVFTAADVEDAMPLLDAWVAAAHQRGSLLAYRPAKCFRGLTWLSQGALAEAEADIRDSMWTVETAFQDTGQPIAGAYLADVLMEQVLSGHRPP